VVVTGALLVGWLGWLGDTALTKSRAPVVSRAQAAASVVPVVARLTDGNKELRALHARGAGVARATTALRGDDGKPAFAATVVEQLTPTGPATGSQIAVGNLPAAGGYVGPGDYLLLLVKDDDATIDDHPAYYLVGQQRSPGAELADIGPPMIYAWTDETRADLERQVRRLFP
jgi:type II secretory pathway pseudopilin PulG